MRTAALYLTNQAEEVFILSWRSPTPQRRVNTAHHLRSSLEFTKIFPAAADTAAVRVLGVPKTSQEDARLPCPRATATASWTIRTGLTETTRSACWADSLPSFIPASLREAAQPTPRDARGYSGLSITATPAGGRRIRQGGGGACRHRGRRSLPA